MSAFTRAWLRAEAEHQGLALTEGDVEAIYDRVRTIKAALVALRPEVTEGLEPPYEFVVAEEPEG
ncbi:MAG TPA: hypothetical protein VKV57_06385 [bacterium]|nr:hypothetical protein [bacterium]